jgi:hypothetical protein
MTATMFAIAAPGFILMTAAAGLLFSNLVVAMLSLAGFSLLCATRPKFSDAQARALMISPLVPAISLLLDGRGAAMAIAFRIDSLMLLPYSNFEVIVIWSGGSHEDLAALVDCYHLYKSRRPVGPAVHAFKPIAILESRDAHRLVVVVCDTACTISEGLNSALAASRMPLVGVVEPGSMPIAEGLVALMRPTLDRRDDPPPACAGLALLAPANPVDRVASHWMQRSCIRMSSIIGRVEASARAVAMNEFRAPFPELGDFVLFNRKALVDSGGFENLPGAAVMSAFLRLDLEARRRGSSRPMFIPEPVSTRDPPQSLGATIQGRVVGALAELRVVRSNFSVMFSPACGSLGLIALPWALLRILTPAVAVLGYILAAIGLGLGSISPMQAVLFLLATGGFGLLRRLAALALFLCVPRFVIAPSLNARQKSGSFTPRVTRAPPATPIRASPATSPAANRTPGPLSEFAFFASVKLRRTAPSRIATLRPKGR